MSSFKPEHLIVVFVGWEILGIYLANTLIITSGLLILIAMLILIKKEKEKNLMKTSKLANMMFKRYHINKFHIGTDNLSGVGINENKKEIVFLSRRYVNDEFKATSIRFNELFEIKLFEDDLAITSTSRASQLGGALVGGMLAGGVGAIIGGSGGTQYSEKKVRKIELQFVIDNLNNPIQTVSFLNEDLHVGKHEKKYKTQYSLANNWYKMFSVILKRNEKEYKHS